MMHDVEINSLQQWGGRIPPMCGETNPDSLNHPPRSSGGWVLPVDQPAGRSVPDPNVRSPASYQAQALLARPLAL